jgi:tRNA-specific 2-thiouridylase
MTETAGWLVRRPASAEEPRAVGPHPTRTYPGPVRVLAAVSGGVDSAVAAARAKDAGHDVVGVHMALAGSGGQAVGQFGCWSAENADDARRAAQVLGIGFELWDLAEQFQEIVVAGFLAEYAAGRTPNPCVHCNRTIKFGVLLDRALALGFDAVCTGHYARVETGPDGTCVLHRARDLAKDQSYVLAAAGPDRLARAMFPLGGVASKSEVRAEAAARGLGVSHKRDSYDICFIPDGDTAGFLRGRLGSQPGAIVDLAGVVVGRHDGAQAYTVGQRRGLGLGRPVADGRPRYVVGVRPATNEVVVGSAEELDVVGLRGTGAVWFERPDAWRECAVQVRAHGTPVAARMRALTDDDGRPGLEVRLAEPLRGLATGQSVVAYDGTRVLGQATVASTRR